VRKPKFKQRGYMISTCDGHAERAHTKRRAVSIAKRLATYGNNVWIFGGPSCGKPKNWGMFPDGRLISFDYDRDFRFP
jgi:hypothetical protein